LSKTGAFGDYSDDRQSASRTACTAPKDILAKAESYNADYWTGWNSGTPERRYEAIKPVLVWIVLEEGF